MTSDAGVTSAKMPWCPFLVIIPCDEHRKKAQLTERWRVDGKAVLLSPLQHYFFSPRSPTPYAEKIIFVILYLFTSEFLVFLCSWLFLVPLEGLKSSGRPVGKIAT